MIESIQQLINALRAELQEYGEMLALLDRQQQMVMERAASEVLQSVGLIQTQAIVVRDARSDRERKQRVVARHAGQPEDATFAALIPTLPIDYRPLTKALVDENNELLARVQQRARQNHLLLARSLELMQGLMDSLLPSREVHVYNGRGNMQAHSTGPRSFYQAVG